MFSTLKRFHAWSQMTDLPTILVDHRERLSGLAAALQKYPQFEVEECHLPSGDVVVGPIGIERKTEHDFYKSLQDGRLFRQLLVMKRSFTSTLMIIEGLDPHQRPPGIRGVIAKITAGLQTPILFTSDMTESVTYIHSIAIQLAALHQRTYQPKRLPDRRDITFQQIFFLAGLPGVGPVRARALLKHFGTLHHILTATKADLEQVPGIGAVFAKELAELLSAKYSG